MVMRGLFFFESALLTFDTERRRGDQLHLTVRFYIDHFSLSCLASWSWCVTGTGTFGVWMDD